VIRLKRAYEPYSRDDGYRILVERLWPRGIRKADAHIDLWLKDVAPSTALRKWFGHDPAKWDEFRKRYWRELDGKPDQIAALKEKTDAGPVTFVFSSRDTVHDAAVALKEYLEGNGDLQSQRR
jgi:uncharacterized protein YeaO (DUF488 family)